MSRKTRNKRKRKKKAKRKAAPDVAVSAALEALATEPAVEASSSAEDLEKPPSSAEDLEEPPSSAEASSSGAAEDLDELDDLAELEAELDASGAPTLDEILESAELVEEDAEPTPATAEVDVEVDNPRPPGVRSLIFRADPERVLSIARKHLQHPSVRGVGRLTELQAVELERLSMREIKVIATAYNLPLVNVVEGVRPHQRQRALPAAPAGAA